MSGSSSRAPSFVAARGALGLLAGVLLLLRPAPAFADASDDADVRPAFPEFERGEDVEETYALNTFGIVHQEVSSPFAIVFGHAWWRPVRGKYRQALEYRKFYEALGRPDLADAQESHHLWCGVMIWGGLALEIGGAVLFFTGLSDGDFSVQSKIGLGLFAGGLVTSAVGATIDDPAIDEEQAYTMSQAYNGALRGHLGLGASTFAPSRSPRVARVSVRPALGRRGAGLTLALAF